MTEPRPSYSPTVTDELRADTVLCNTVSIVPETDWKARINTAIRRARDERKNCIIIYDWRLNIARIIPHGDAESVKIE